MRNMLKLTVLVACTLSVVSLQAESSGCARCDEIRAYNAEHPQKAEYYEDYLKEHPAEKSNTNAPAKPNTTAPVKPENKAPANPVSDVGQTPRARLMQERQEAKDTREQEQKDKEQKLQVQVQKIDPNAPQ